MGRKNRKKKKPGLLFFLLLSGGNMKVDRSYLELASTTRELSYLISTKHKVCTFITLLTLTPSPLLQNSPFHERYHWDKKVLSHKEVSFPSNNFPPNCLTFSLGSLYTKLEILKLFYLPHLSYSLISKTTLLSWLIIL